MVNQKTSFNLCSIVDQPIKNCGPRQPHVLTKSMLVFQNPSWNGYMRAYYTRLHMVIEAEFEEIIKEKSIASTFQPVSKESK